MSIELPMKPFIGTKQINAAPMSRQAYNDFRGWELPANEDGADEGYLVEYVDGGEANTDQFEGYVSWSPKDVFERAYHCSGEMTFGEALQLLKVGFKMARKGWNGKGMWIIHVPGTPNVRPVAGTPYSKAGITEAVQILGHIDMYTVDSSGRRAMLPGWLASQSDMLSEDWVIVE